MPLPEGHVIEDLPIPSLVNRILSLIPSLEDLPCSALHPLAHLSTPPLVRALPIHHLATMTFLEGSVAAAACSP